jgi:2-hydroxychromene-2-carboxylate isomerase
MEEQQVALVIGGEMFFGKDRLREVEEEIVRLKAA